MAWENMLKKTNPLGAHYSMENPGTIYDEEAMTALELAGRTASKVNELVTNVNATQAYVELNIDQQNKNIPILIAQDVQGHIDNGDFEQAINEYAGDLEGRLDTLLGNVAPGQTTSNRDAEVIDGRTGQDGMSYANLGGAIRGQFAKTLMRKTEPSPDADVCKETGLYFVGSSTTWANLPEGEVAGVLMTLYQLDTRFYQLFVGHQNAMYIRNAGGDKVWHPLEDARFDDLMRDSVMAKRLDIADGETFDMGDNAFWFPGFWVYGSSTPVLNSGNDSVPAGVLISFSDPKKPTQGYHVNINYAGETYVRYRVNINTWTPWARLLTESDLGAMSPGGSGETAPYFVKGDGDGSGVYIHRRTVNGYVRYWYGNHVDNNINLNTYRLMAIDVCDKNMKVLHNISGIGVDQEGVIKFVGADDFTGGCHGHENWETFRLLINGKEYLPNEIPVNGVNADEVKVYVKSLLEYEGDETFIRYKWLTFNVNGVEFFNTWYGYTEEYEIETLYPAMLSINKALITEWCDDVIISPVEVTDYDPEASEINSGWADEHNVWFSGLISAHIEMLGEVSESPYTLYDYGDRYKVYFGFYELGGGDDTIGIRSRHRINILY